VIDQPTPEGAQPTPALSPEQVLQQLQVELWRGHQEREMLVVTFIANQTIALVY
jgi:hypothetical protein